MPDTLKVTTPTDREIVMTRDFNAPPRLVWEAMTRPELIRRWLFLPDGWTMTVCNEDVRVGGAFRWEWAGPDGATAMIMTGVYREVVHPERIVRTESFTLGCDNQLGEQLATLTFKEIAGGRTAVTITLVYPSREARDGMICSGMEHGVATGYNNLDQLLVAGF